MKSTDLKLSQSMNVDKCVNLMSVLLLHFVLLHKRINQVGAICEHQCSTTTQTILVIYLDFQRINALENASCKGKTTSLQLVKFGQFL